jgi:hypothetical protein
MPLLEPDPAGAEGVGAAGVVEPLPNENGSDPDEPAEGAGDGVPVEPASGGENSEFFLSSDMGVPD